MPLWNQQQSGPSPVFSFLQLSGKVLLSIVCQEQNERRRLVEKNGVLFFSVIIPAHNEEGYIDRTLASLRDIDYPRDRYEVIVVENGSTDRTREIIDEYASTSLKRMSIGEASVSKARNQGMLLLSRLSEWVIFLDADTSLGTAFFRELDLFLQKNAGRDLGSGMVSLLPDPDSRLARGWYRFYNLANRLTGTTRSIQCIRRDLLNSIRYDESLTFGEDTRMLRDCNRRSRHFYLKTTSVFSSTRRFQKRGWMRQLFSWIYLTALPYEKKRSTRYTVIR